MDQTKSKMKIFCNYIFYGYNKKIFAIIICCIIFGASYFSIVFYKNNKRRVAIRKAISANNEFAIQALNRGESIHASGIQVSTMEARQLLLGGPANKEETNRCTKTIKKELDRCVPPIIPH